MDLIRTILILMLLSGQAAFLQIERYPVLYFLHGRGGDYLLYWRAISREIPGAHEDAGAWITNLISAGRLWL